MGRCVVYTRIRLLLLILPFISPFFFLSNCQILKFFVTLFSGTVRPRRLKLGTHIDSGQMYCVYRNQAAAAYSSLYFFSFLSLQFSNIKIFCCFLAHLSRRLTRWAYRMGLEPASVRPSMRASVHPHFQTWISPRPAGRLQSNFIWSIIGVGERLH